MIYILPGSHAVDIVTILSVAGEFSFSSSRLLGSDAVMRRTIRSMSESQEILMDDMRYFGQLLNVTGHGVLKSVKLRKWAYPILKAIKAEEYYKETFGSKRFQGDRNHKERNFRVAECLMMFFRAGIEFRPYALPKLQCEEFKKIVPFSPCFYLAKDLKKLNPDELPKTQFTRVTGMLFIGRKPYAVYNTRTSLMKWNGGGEHKTLLDFEAITRMNAERNDLDSAIVFYGSEKTALDTIRDIKKNEKLDFGFMNIYHNVHFIPLGENGIRQLKLFTRPNWWERVIKRLFGEYAVHIGYYVYDAVINGKEIFCFLDGDVARLIRFKNSLRNNQYGFVCFSHQIRIIDEYFAYEVEKKVMTFEQVEKLLSL